MGTGSLLSLCQRVWQQEEQPLFPWDRSWSLTPGTFPVAPQDCPWLIRTFHIIIYKEGGEGLQVEFQDRLAMTLLPARPGSAVSFLPPSSPVLGAWLVSWRPGDTRHSRSPRTPAKKQDRCVRIRIWLESAVC